MTNKVESRCALVILIAGTKKKMKVIFFWHLEGHRRKQDPNPILKGADSDSDPLVIGPDPDPYQNITDPEHWFKETEA
jgi:hypothetical protein